MLDEQVEAVGHHFQHHDLPSPFIDLDPDQLIQPHRDPAVEERAAVLQAPHHVQPQVVHAAHRAGGPPWPQLHY